MIHDEMTTAKKAAANRRNAGDLSLPCATSAVKGGQS